MDASAYIPDLRLERKDFQAIVSLFLIDLAVTVYGILYAGGSEANPMFRPFTSGLSLMILGGAIYIGILAILNKFLTGRVRKVLASVAIGMHFSAIISWLMLFANIDFSVSISYLYNGLIALSTAVAFSELEKRNWTY